VDDEYPETMFARRSTRGAALALTLAVGLGAAALLGGCGSGTKTVSVSGAPSATTTSSASTATSRGTATASATGSTTTATSPATRTATGPAFTHGETSSGAAGTAAAVVKAHGYTPNDLAQYHPSQTLRVLVGTGSRSNDGHDQQAFFFVNGRYIGTDTSRPSASVAVTAQSDTEVTLSYPLYRPHDALCCPSGGHASVRFQLNNGRLTPLDTIPPASSQTGLSRQ
jgi:hypothetical protein